MRGQSRLRHLLVLGVLFTLLFGGFRSVLAEDSATPVAEPEINEPTTKPSQPETTFEPADDSPQLAAGTSSFSASIYSIYNDGSEVSVAIHISPEDVTANPSITITAIAPVQLSRATVTCESAPSYIANPSDAQTLFTTLPFLLGQACDVTFGISVMTGTAPATLDGALFATLSGGGIVGPASVVVEDLPTPTPTPAPPISLAMAPSFTVPNDGSPAEVVVDVTVQPQAPIIFSLTVNLTSPLLAAQPVSASCDGGGTANPVPLQPTRVSISFVRGPNGEQCTVGFSITVPAGTPAGTLTGAITASVATMQTITADVVIQGVSTPTPSPTPTATPTETATPGITAAFDKPSYSVDNAGDGDTFFASVVITLPNANTPLTEVTYSVPNPFGVMGFSHYCVGDAVGSNPYPSPNGYSVQVHGGPGSCIIRLLNYVVPDTPPGTREDVLTLSADGLGVLASADVVVNIPSTPTPTNTPVPTETPTPVPTATPTETATPALTAAFDKPSYSVDNAGDANTFHASVVITLPNADTPLTGVTYSVPDPLGVMAFSFYCTGNASGQNPDAGAHAYTLEVYGGSGTCTIRLLIDVGSGTPAGTLEDALTLTADGIGVLATADVVVSDPPTPTPEPTSTATPEPTNTPITSPTPTEGPSDEITLAFAEPSYTVPGNGGTVRFALNIVLPHSVEQIPFTIDTSAPVNLGYPVGVDCTGELPFYSVNGSSHRFSFTITAGAGVCTVSLEISVPTGTPAGVYEDALTARLMAHSPVVASADVIVEDITTPTVEPTGTATPEQSTVIVSVSTEDDGALPPSTTVCLGTICQQADENASIGAARALLAASDTTFTFAIAPGTYSLTVRDAAPYADVATSVTVEANTSITVPLTLSLTAVTPTPQATGTAAPVTNLPNTGAPGASGSDLWRTIWLAGGVALLFLLAGVLLRRRAELPGSDRRR